MRDQAFLTYYATRLRERGRSCDQPLIDRIALIASATPANIETPNIGALPGNEDPDADSVIDGSDRQFLFDLSFVMDKPVIDFNHKLRFIALTKDYVTTTV